MYLYLFTLLFFVCYKSKHSFSVLYILSVAIPLFVEEEEKKNKRFCIVSVFCFFVFVNALFFLEF